MSDAFPLTGYLKNFQDCTWTPDGFSIPFLIDGEPLGWVSPDHADRLAEAVKDFAVTKNVLELKTSGSFKARTVALKKATPFLQRVSGERLQGEMSLILNSSGQAVAEIDRGLTIVLGLHVVGVNLVGWFKKDGETHFWLGQRSPRISHASQFDVLAGGGVSSAHYETTSNLTEDSHRAAALKALAEEAYGEAGIDAQILQGATHINNIHFTCARTNKDGSRRGIRNETAIVYLIELPTDFQPHNRDGEVAQFNAVSASELGRLIGSGNKIKYNCNLVFTSALLNLGLLNASPEYADLKAFLSHERPRGSSPPTNTCTYWY